VNPVSRVMDDAERSASRVLPIINRNPVFFRRKLSRAGTAEHGGVFISADHKVNNPTPATKETIPIDRIFLNLDGAPGRKRDDAPRDCPRDYSAYEQTFRHFRVDL
ncbi:MAG: hypothetical protein ACREGR_04115, partial [Minisyncoccia bacterium]